MPLTPLFQPRTAVRLSLLLLLLLAPLVHGVGLDSFPTEKLPSKAEIEKQNKAEQKKVADRERADKAKEEEVERLKEENRRLQTAPKPKPEVKQAAEKKAQAAERKAEELERQLREAQRTKVVSPNTDKAPALANPPSELSYAPLSVFRDKLSDGSLGPEMVVIPSGSFDMGSPESQTERNSDEGPVQRITLKRYALGKTEVTQKQWRQVMGSDPVSLGFKGCDDCPVEGVSWYEVKKYIDQLNAKTGKQYRLPSESEWEYACRGGKAGEKYCGGNDVGLVGWYGKNSADKTHPVGQKQPNGYGLVDMSGNVNEWVEDVYPDTNLKDLIGKRAESVFMPVAKKIAIAQYKEDLLNKMKQSTASNTPGFQEAISKLSAQDDPVAYFEDNLKHCKEQYKIAAENKDTEEMARQIETGKKLVSLIKHANNSIEETIARNYSGIPRYGSAWTVNGDQRLRVLRGGSWGDSPRDLRSAFRGVSTPDIRNNYFGFRLARTLP